MNETATPERISDFVSLHALQQPERQAAVLDGRTVSYAQLDAAMQAYGRAMIASGIQKGDRVATLAPPGIEYLVTFLAAISVGAIWIGLNPVYQLRELLVVLRDANPSLLLARTRIRDRSFDDELAAIAAEIGSIKTIVALDEMVPGAVDCDSFLARGAQVSDAAYEAARRSPAPADPCLIVYTSGTTGTPKGAVLSHRGLAGTSVEQNRIWPVEDLRILNYFPINHVGCVADVTCPTLTAAGCLVFLEKYDTAESLRLIEEQRVTCLLTVPSVYQMQLDHPDFARRDLSSVELIIWEGAALPREIIRRLLDWCDRLATNYGLTESVGAVTVLPPSSDVDELDGSVGFPNIGVEVRLVDLEGNLVEGEGEGELQARSAYNMLGYWNNPEASAATIVDGWLRTGDLAARTQDGRYKIVGRLKEMYKSGGYNVYPREVETVIEEIPGVALAAVVGVADPVWQEVGIAYVIADDNLDADTILKHCRTRLANYKVPKRVFVHKELPLLPIGKVDKGALRNLYAEQPA